MLLELIKNDFRQQYLGSYLGIIWAFIQPIVTILVFWFVFQVGFKSKPINDFPFILWLVAGIVPWFFMADSWPKTTGSILEYSFLVKQVMFKIKLLPVIKIGSSILIHLFFIFFTLMMFWFYGFSPDIYILQLPYYLFSFIVLLMGVSWLSSALQVFLKDSLHCVNLILQLGFWGTPIFWSKSMMPENIQWLLKLNPMYYIIQGYRDTFINKVWFWEYTNLSLYFWCFALITFVVGALTFKQLKPHFADVL